MIYLLAILLSFGVVTADLDNNFYLSPQYRPNQTHHFHIDNDVLEPVCEKGGTYTLPHRKFCDRFYSCKDGRAVEEQCMDGLAYVSYVGCKPLHVVDCSKRPMLQPPKGTGKCPRLYGIFNDPRGCGAYFRCENGRATEAVCPQRYMFDDRRKQCRKPLKWEALMCFPQGSHHNQMQQHHEHTGQPYPQPTPHEEEQGLNHFLEGFRCPDFSLTHLPFGQHSRHPYPGNCRYFIMCMKDGTMKLAGCEAGLAYSPVTGVCEAEHLVENCKRNRSL